VLPSIICPQNTQVRELADIWANSDAQQGITVSAAGKIEATADAGSGAGSSDSLSSRGSPAAKPLAPAPCAHCGVGGGKHVGAGGGSKPRERAVVLAIMGGESSEDGATAAGLSPHAGAGGAAGSSPGGLALASYRALTDEIQIHVAPQR
jgi:hypothetical protein